MQIIYRAEKFYKWAVEIYHIKPVSCSKWKKYPNALLYVIRSMSEKKKKVNSAKFKCSISVIVLANSYWHRYSNYKKLNLSTAEQKLYFSFFLLRNVFHLIIVVNTKLGLIMSLKLLLNRRDQYSVVAKGSRISCLIYMTLCHKDYFRVVIFRKEQIQGKLWKPSYPFVRDICIYKRNFHFKNVSISVVRGLWLNLKKHLSLKEARILMTNTCRLWDV